MQLQIAAPLASSIHSDMIFPQSQPTQHTTNTNTISNKNTITDNKLMLGYSEIRSITASPPPQMKTPKRERQVRFSDKSYMYVFNNFPQIEEASKLWYSQEEIDCFNERFLGRVREVRTQLGHHRGLTDEGCISLKINAAAILGFEKHLSPDLTEEYRDRRDALQRAVLAEHRQRRAMRISRSTARLATVSAQHSRWARERARAVALFLEKDMMQDLKEISSS